MGWTKQESVASNLVTLGDDDGHVKKVGGLLAAIKQDPNPKYKNPLYELVQKDGSSVLLAGSASLSRQIHDDHVGKFLKAEFTGWGTSPNGKFKAIDVYVWTDEPTAEMKKWPRWAELNAPKVSAKATAEKIRDDFDDPPLSEEPGDDLPF